MKLLLALCLWIACAAPAVELPTGTLPDKVDKGDQVADLKVSVNRFLERTCKCEPSADAWRTKFEARVKQKAQDSGLEEEVCARIIAYDWAADKANAIKDLKAIKELDAMTLREACLLLQWFWQKNIALPEKVRKELTDDRALEMAKWLDQKK